MSTATYRQYMDFELRMTLDQVEVIALRDPQFERDQASNPDNPDASETTGTIQGDQRRWLREHSGADAAAPMEVKVMDVSTPRLTPSGWLTLDQVDEFIAKGRSPAVA